MTEVAFFELAAIGAENCGQSAIVSKPQANFPMGSPVGRNAKPPCAIYGVPLDLDGLAFLCRRGIDGLAFEAV